MLFCIGDVLNAEEISAVREILGSEKYYQGHKTAGWAARDVKNNLQMKSKSQGWCKLQRVVREALQRNDVFALAAAPKVISPLLFSKYEVGMGYGDHVDDAVMGGKKSLRSDLSFTVFLSDPNDYDGGELIIEDTQGEQSFKLPVGSVLLYPSTNVHRVATVTRGNRQVAVGWVQCMVREIERRQVLFDLETLRRQAFSANGKTAEFDTLSKTVSNLWRMWADI